MERVSHGLMPLYLWRAEQMGGCWALSCLLCTLPAAVLRGVLRFKESISHHFPFTLKMLPFPPHSPLNELKKKSKTWRREQTCLDTKRMATSKSKQGWKNVSLLFLGHASNKRDMEKVYGKKERASKIPGFCQFCHSLCVSERTIIAAEEVIL